jgi:hypothetical protein
MQLVTPKVAAKEVFVTGSMISYWVKKGRVKKYPIEGMSRNYLVDLDEVRKAFNWKNQIIENRNDDLISRSEAAALLYVEETVISYYARRGYIKKYYVFGNDFHYLVSKSEVLAQVEEIQKRVAEHGEKLRKHYLANPQMKDRHGKFIPTKNIFRL